MTVSDTYVLADLAAVDLTFIEELPSHADTWEDGSDGDITTVAHYVDARVGDVRIPLAQEKFRVDVDPFGAVIAYLPVFVRSVNTARVGKVERAYMIEASGGDRDGSAGATTPAE